MKAQEKQHQDNPKGGSTMKLDVEKTLKKKAWKGEEVGRLLMASLIHDIRHSKDADYKPILEQSEFNVMASSLKTKRDCYVLKVYSKLYESLAYLSNQSQLYMQQIWHGCYRYMLSIYQCTYAELEQGQILESKVEWKPIFDRYYLDKLPKDKKYHDFLRSEMLGCVRIIKLAYRYIISYNLVVGILGKAYAIDEAEALKLTCISQAEEKFEAINDLRSYLLENLSGTPKEKQRKKKMLDEFLLPLDYSAWQIPQNVISSTEKYLIGLKFKENAASAVFQRKLDSLVRKIAGTEED